MSQQFPLLFSPIQVGKYVLRNRIVNTAHATGFGHHGGPGEQHIYYHRERARGGLGMIIMETMNVHETGIWYYRNVDDSVVPWYKEISNAVHPYGVPILQQLTHFGKRITTNLSAYETYAVGPSADPPPT
ncbi:MAG: hypothetical protein HY683_09020, partial [Chloroflexi bacterium]|nr:hypothetical protein [Chloroflexota bacterium]